MDKDQELIEFLASRAKMSRESTITIVEEGRSLSLGELLDESRHAAMGLVARGVCPGDRVAFILPNESSFLRMLFGAQYAQAVPVPLAPPFGVASLADYVQHVSGVVADSGAAVLVVDPKMAQLYAALGTTLTEVAVVAFDEVDALAGDLPGGPVDHSQPAFIQYTSGSTSAPKGVVLTHGNLIAGLNAIAQPTEVTSADRWGVWAPLFHDMGIFSFLTALSVGCDIVLWQPRSFVRDPLGWLCRFVDEGCTLSPAPNFALDMLVSASRVKGLPADLDLSRWRLLYNGGEPVNVNSIREFQDVFGPSGFQPEAMYPVFGMAEATLLVTCPPLGRAPMVRWADREALLSGSFVPAEAHAATARALISLGSAVPGVRIRIRSEEKELPEGLVGQIELSGAVVTQGYFGRSPGEERSPDGWLRTGDLGVLLDGELHIVGRSKDLIIHRGVNYYAEDIEAVIRDLPEISRKRCAAIPHEERMAVIIETSLEDLDECMALEKAARGEIASRLGITDLSVHLVPPRSLPLTSSGKLQRRRLRALVDDLLMRRLRT
jgi:fatty-acyl-CoA synthase